MVAQLIEAEDPAALVESWETPDNCESPGYGRVRIDNG